MPGLSEISLRVGRRILTLRNDHSLVINVFHALVARLPITFYRIYLFVFATRKAKKNRHVFSAAVFAFIHYYLHLFCKYDFGCFHVIIAKFYTGDIQTARYIRVKQVNFFLTVAELC